MIVKLSIELEAPSVDPEGPAVVNVRKSSLRAQISVGIRQTINMHAHNH